jgi:hypothetical protein
MLCIERNLCQEHKQVEVLISKEIIPSIEVVSEESFAAANQTKIIPNITVLSEEAFPAANLKPLQSLAPQ